MTRTRAVTIARHTMATRYVENNWKRPIGWGKMFAAISWKRRLSWAPLDMQAIGNFELAKCVRCVRFKIGDPSGFRRSQPDDIRFPWNSADAAAALSQVRHQFVGIGRYNHG